MNLKQVLRCLSCALLLAVPFGFVAHAQDYPIKSVRMLVPYPAGGQPDLVSRTLGAHLGNQFGQSFVIENIPGSGGIQAISNILAAPADGYAMLMADAGMWAVGPAMRAKVSYDMRRDFTPLRQTHTTSLLLATGPGMPPVKDFREFVALVKAKPGFFTYGSAGIGSIQHLTMEGIKAAYGLDLLHVPYKSGATAMPALIGGEIASMITAFSTVTSFTKSGDKRINVVAVTTKARSSIDPNVPSISEYGVPDFDFGSGGALLVRSGTPKAVIDKLAAALDKAFAAPEIATRLKTLSVEYTERSSPDLAAEYIRSDIARVMAAAKSANVAGSLP